jgi:hypothetical protein
MKKSVSLSCPHCGSILRLFGVERHAIVERLALHTYVCPVCDAVQTDVVAIRQDEPAPSRREPVRVLDVLGTCGFDDKTTNLLCTTFDSAWAKLKVSGGPLTDEPVAGATRELLAKCIIALGRRAATNSDGLADKALVFLAYLMQHTLSPLPTEIAMLPRADRTAS